MSHKSKLRSVYECVKVGLERKKKSKTALNVFPKKITCLPDINRMDCCSTRWIKNVTTITTARMGSEWAA